MDGTLCKIAQPKKKQSEVYNGYERVHALKLKLTYFNFKDVLNLESVLFSYPLLGKSFKCSSFCPDNRRLRTLRDNNFTSNCIDIFIKF